MRTTKALRLLVSIAILQPHLFAQSLTRGPAVWETNSDSFLIAFRSSSPAQGSIEWGPTPTLGSTTQGPVTTDHAIRIGGLQPDRFYYYRVLLGGRAVTSIHRTRTFAAARASRAADVTFFVFGDSGSGSPNQYAVSEVLGDRHFDLGLVAGDVVYENGEPWNFDPQFFAPYASLLPSTPFFPVLGNHDLLWFGGTAFLDAFYLPTTNSNSERWFSFDHGDIHFIGLDSSLAFLSEQTTWLRGDLTQARARGARWIFVILHHAPYSSGSHGRYWPVFLLWCPIFEEFEVDAVFTGHDHHYERTSVRRDFHSRKRGVVYYVTGTGGRSVRPLGSIESYTEFATVRFGALSVEVCGDVMRTAFLDATRGPGFAAELDVFTLARGPYEPGLRAATSHPRPGETLGAELLMPAAGSQALFLATAPGYFPLGPTGIWLLGPQAVLLAQGTARAGANAVSLRIPQDASLVGVDLLLQAITLGGGAALTDVMVSRVR